MHSPCQAPPDLRGDNSPEANYCGVLKDLDRQLGRAFAFVRDQAALRDNTLILVCSDNGHEQGLGTSGELRGSKGQLYEGGIRSSMITWCPGRMPAGAARPRAARAGDDRDGEPRRDLPSGRQCGLPHRQLGR